MTGVNKFSFNHFQQSRSSGDFLTLIEYAFKRKRESHVLRSLKLCDDYEFNRYESDKAFTERKGNRHAFGLGGASRSVSGHELKIVRSSYSRHLRIGETMSLSSGGALGLADVSEENDEETQLNSFFDAGLAIYGKRFLIGYSLRNVAFSPIEKKPRSINYRIQSEQRWFLGLRHYLSHPFAAETFFSLTKRKDESTKLEIGGAVEYNERLNFGMYLNDIESIAVHLGVRINYKLLLSYTQDMNKNNSGARKELNIAFNLD
ncbi:type IX secretion system membrane protein PorP/SprF [Ekhidna sp.]